uniref:Uncharacterized protein n=1 Tax=Arundo donax TaxID=35708 RepID=A0A0A9F5C6_ARUDO
MGRCLASTSGGRPDLATRWEQVVQSWCRSCFRDAISTFITSSIDAFSTIPASCFWVRRASSSTPKERAAARVSSARSTAAAQWVCQQPRSPQPCRGSPFCGTSDTCPLYRNCSSSRNTS